ncbi:MAG TPA: family 10 glycosylhydrolase [Bacteroidota bacterium]
MRHCHPAAILVVLLLAGGATLTAQVYPKREFRGAWLATVANIDWPRSPGDPADLQKTQLTTLLDALRAAGISSVIFQVRPECDAFYQSTIEPWSYYLTGTQGVAASYDPLQFAVDEAHKRGMELHAWFNPYRAVRVIGLFPIALNHVSVLHPDWILTFPADNQKLLDPGLPQVRSYVARVVSDIVRRYDVDGLHADDYFYPYSGITKQDSATFANFSRGIPDIGSWRRDNVNLLMAQIADSVKAIKPWVKFGMSPFGIWKSGVPPGIKGLDAYNEIYGDAMAWLHQHSIDYLTPQLYWKIGGPQDYAALMAWWADSVAAYGRHLYTGNQFVTSYSTAELPNQLALNRGNPKVGGQILFSANGITSDALAFADSLKSHQYRYPALAPVMGWKDTTPPYMPRGIRYAALPGGGPAALQWDLPIVPPSGDTAYRYVVYRFDHRPAASELTGAQNMLSVEGRRWFVPPAPPSPAGPYYFVVTALSRNYVESDTSNIVILTPPSVPLLLSPLNGTANSPESLLVSWNAVPLTSVYQLQVGADSTFATGLIWNESSITDTTRLVKGFQGQTLYFWRVRAGNGGGTSPWSAVYRFRTGFPASPGPVFPANFQVDLPVFLTLRWNASLSGITSSFRVQLARSADFVSLVMDSAGVSDTTLGAPPLEYFTLYFWRVRATNSVGTSPWSPGYKFRTVQVTGIEPVPDGPSTFGLDQNYPNPFNPTTMIGYQLPSAGRVTIIVYDMLGQEVERLVDAVEPAGRHAVPWNGSNHASGVYLVRMNAATFTSTKRLLLLK